jgi:hypothetical protein
LRWILGVLFLSLLVAPPAGATDPEALLRPGELEIAVDPAAASFLPIDTTELAPRLCSGLPPVDWAPPISPRGECDLSVSPPPGLSLFVDDIVALGGSWQVSLHPTGWEPWRGKTPVVTTSCGLWEVSMELDPDEPQPLSEVILKPSTANPAQGAFAGVLSLAVRFRFADPDTGTSLTVPSRLALELHGHWAAVPEGTPGLEDSASNLLLYAGSFGGELLSMPSCVTWRGSRCPLCLQPPPDVLDRLNLNDPDDPGAQH